jgi:hypothetical protein
VINQSLKDIENINTSDALQKIKVPYLMVQGEDDPIEISPIFKYFGE